MPRRQKRNQWKKSNNKKNFQERKSRVKGTERRNETSTLPAG
ncbi:44659_t:CDS:1, partial [Gigaspora margarita]